MAETIYILCGITSAFCALLLFKAYWKSKTVLLLWSSLCFGAIALNNTLLIVDLILLPTQVELSLLRSSVLLLGFILLLYGLIWGKA